MEEIFLFGRLPDGWIQVHFTTSRVSPQKTMLVEEIQYSREYFHVAHPALQKRQNVGYHGAKLFPLNQIKDLESSREIHNPMISLYADSISFIPFE